MIEDESIYSIEDDTLKRLVTLPITLGRSYGPAQPFTDNNGSVYFTAKDKVIRYDLKTGTQSDVYTVNPQAKGIVSVKTDTKRNKLYITEQTEATAGRDKFRVKEISLSDNKEREIPQIPTVMYGNMTYLMYAEGADIVGSFGGDGCGGYGEIYRITGTKTEKAIDTGMGCDKNPRFVKADEKTSSILLYSVEKNDPLPEEEMWEEKLDTLYLQNAFTGEKNVLYDFKSENRSNGKFVVNEDLSKIAYFDGKSTEIISLASKKTESVIPVNISYHFAYWYGNKIYALELNEKKVATIDTNSGKISELSFAAYFNPVGNSPRVIGQWDGKALLFVETY